MKTVEEFEELLNEFKGLCEKTPLMDGAIMDALDKVNKATDILSEARQEMERASKERNEHMDKVDELRARILRSYTPGDMSVVAKKPVMDTVEQDEEGVIKTRENTYPINYVGKKGKKASVEIDRTPRPIRVYNTVTHDEVFYASINQCCKENGWNTYQVKKACDGDNVYGDFNISYK